MLFSAGLSAQQTPAKPSQPFPSKVAWSKALSAEPSTLPLVAGDRIVIALDSGTVMARRLTDGEEIWSVTRKVDMPMSVDDGLIIVAGDGEVAAIEISDGKEIWKIPTGKLTAPPLVRGGWVVLGEAGKLAAFRASDGARIWERDSAEVVERPAIDGGRLFVAQKPGLLVALDLESGKPLWDRQLASSPTEPLVIGDRVYVGDDSKQFFCLKAENGERDFVLNIGYRTLGRADVDDAHLYITGVDNTLRAYDRINGALRWKQGVTFRPISGPLVIGPHVLLAGLTAEIPGFDQKTGKPAGKLTLDQRLAVAPAVANPVPNAAPAGLVVVTTEAGQPSKLSLALTPEPAAAPVAKTGVTESQGQKR
jgi:outer membrane protein assembly factor BamB